jgi:hypothetical protein
MKTHNKRILIACTIAVLVIATAISAMLYIGPAVSHPGYTCNPPVGHGRAGCHRSVTTTTKRKITTTTVVQTTTTVAPTTTGTIATTTTSIPPVDTTTSNTPVLSTTPTTAPVDRDAAELSVPLALALLVVMFALGILAGRIVWRR